MVQDMFLRSEIARGVPILGMIVTNSFFQQVGHTLVLVISL